ncbi:MAG: ATP-binding cassette domain-containing protein, partial [Clostridiales bacterium]
MLAFKNVSFTYANGNKIIENMSFTFNSHETLGLVGCNGAGKSTLLSLICGINLPTAGEIIINDTVIEKKTL